VKIRKSSSLLAAGCTVCIATASGVVAPQASAAAPPAVSVVSRDVALRASVDPFAIASLPLQNLLTTISAFQAVGAAGINPLNAAFAAFAKGDVAGIGTALYGYVGNEVTAIANLLNLPATLIETDLAAIGFLQSAVSSATTLAATDSVGAAAVDPATGFLALASLPLQNLLSTISAFQGVGAAAINPLNAAFAAFSKGDIAGITTALNNYLVNELAAFNKVLALPATIISTDLAAINGIFGAAQSAALSATPLAATTADVSAAAADPVSGFLTLASLPLQNTLSTISAFQAVGAAAINPLNTAFAAFAKGDVAGIGTALNNYFVNELTAINKLLGLPASIIAQDIAAVTGAFGGATMLGSGARTFAAADVEEQPAIGAAAPSADDTATPSAQSKHQQAGDAQKSDTEDAGSLGDHSGADRAEPGDAGATAGTGTDGQSGDTPAHSGDAISDATQADGDTAGDTHEQAGGTATPGVTSGHDTTGSDKNGGDKNDDGKGGTDGAGKAGASHEGAHAKGGNS
jgi:hypothetical protein